MLPPVLPILVLFLAALPAAELPQAPDGHPGLGTTRSAHEYARLFASPEGEERELLARLAGLEGEIAVLQSTIAAAYRRRDLMALAGEEATLAELHAAYGELEDEVLPLVCSGGERGRRLGTLFLDVRFRLRREVLADLAREAPDVRRGLAVLRAQHDGYVVLRDQEAQEIARRVDLAASFLRAMRLDLEALRDADDPRAAGAVDAQWSAQLFGLAEVSDAERRAQAFADLARRVERRQEQMASALFTPRLRAKLAEERERRALRLEESASLLPRIRPLLPETKEGEDPPEEVAELPTFRRYGYALRLAVEALAADPLDDETTFYAALGAEFGQDPRTARGWFDRFLALRGIRSHDHRTYADRELDEREQRALAAVQLPTLPPIGR